MPVKSAGLLNRRQQQGLNEYFNNPITNNQTYQAGNSYLQNLLQGGPNAFNDFEAPHLQNFQQNVIPGIANRFAGMGTGAGALNSSAFNQTAAQAGSTLQAQLAQIRGGLQMQAAPQALAYAQQPYSNLLNGINVQTKENFFQPDQPSMGSTLLGGLAQTAVTGFANAVMPGSGSLYNAASNLYNNSGGGGMNPSAQGYNQEFRQQGLPAPGY